MSDLNALDLESGQMVGGYTLVSRIGGGAMGSVWRVRDGGGTEYAMKILRDSLNDDETSDDGSGSGSNGIGLAAPGATRTMPSDPTTAINGSDINSTMQIRHNPRLNARERLRREAMALQHVRHPGVCSIVDMELDDSLAFIVTELIEGRNLRDDVAANGRYVGQDLERLARKLIEAVEAVHARGIIHRDIKPTNVMVSAEGPVLVDFGIAMEAGESHVTRTGLVMGTPGFIAPEIIDGAESNEATDWWSLASVLAFAATGRPVFGTTPMMTVLEREAAGNANLAGLPPHTLAAFRTALSPDPAQRCSPKALLDSIMADAINPMAGDDDDFVDGFGGDTAGPAELGGTGAGLPFDGAAARELNPDAADNPRKQWDDNDLKDAEATQALGHTAGGTQILSRATGSTRVINRSTRGASNMPNVSGASDISDADGFNADSEMTQTFNPDTEATQAFDPDAEATQAFAPNNPSAYNAEATQALNPNNLNDFETEMTRAFDPATAPGGTRVMPVGSADLADQQATTIGAPPVAAPGIVGSSNAIHPANPTYPANAANPSYPVNPAYPANPAAQIAPPDPNASAVEAATLVAIHRSRLFGRARWVLCLLAIPLAVLAMAYPLIALFTLIAATWLLETLGLSESAQLDREMRHSGRRSSDLVWRATGLPWHALKGLALTVPRALLATFIGILVPMVVASILGTDRVNLTFTLGNQNLPIPLPAGFTDATNGWLLLICAALAWFGATFASHSKTIRLGAGCLMGSARPVNHGATNPAAATPIGPGVAAEYAPAMAPTPASMPASTPVNLHPRRGIAIFAIVLALLTLTALTLTATASGIQWIPLAIE